MTRIPCQLLESSSMTENVTRIRSISSPSDHSSDRVEENLSIPPDCIQVVISVEAYSIEECAEVVNL